jgi:hypothetical protein
VAEADAELAVDYGIIESNPAERVSQRDKVAAEDKRHPYSTEDLNCIFGSILFGGAPPGGRIKHPTLLMFEHSRWLPVLGLFPGARLRELGQLLRTDVGCESGIDYLAITTVSDEEDGVQDPASGGGKSLKTENAVRKVPLHPIILELGFLHYVRALKLLSRPSRHDAGACPPDTYGAFSEGRVWEPPGAANAEGVERQGKLSRSESGPHAELLPRSEKTVVGSARDGKSFYRLAVLSVGVGASLIAARPLDAEVLKFAIKLDF